MITLQFLDLFAVCILFKDPIHTQLFYNNYGTSDLNEAVMMIFSLSGVTNSGMEIIRPVSRRGNRYGL